MKNHAFVGLFGSGKTEIALNFALKLLNEGENVAIADLDYVSPYFRTRDKIGELERMGIKVLVPPGKYIHADTPIIPPEVFGYLSNPNYSTVLDVGGEEDGIAVLGYLRPFLKKTAIYMVVNTRRPFSRNVEEILKTYEKLSRRARTDFQYLVSNTNLGPETTCEIVREGEEILSRVSKILEIPVAFTVVPSFLDCETQFEKFVIERKLALEW